MTLMLDLIVQKAFDKTDISAYSEIKRFWLIVFRLFTNDLPEMTSTFFKFDIL